MATIREDAVQDVDNAIEELIAEFNTLTGLDYDEWRTEMDGQSADEMLAKIEEKCRIEAAVLHGRIYGMADALDIAGA